MMGTKTNRDSHNIMHLIKDNTIGAEVGVWWGNTSKNFLKKNLKQLYLIDPWSVEPYKGTTEFEWDEYIARYANVTGSFSEEGFQRYYDKVYENIMNEFNKYPNVTVRRETSDEFFEQFENEQLDWIYLDGSHAYEGVLADLENSLKVVKSDGIILGDDYKWGDKWGKPGVTKAVNEFAEKYNFKVKQHGVVQFEIRLS